MMPYLGVVSCPVYDMASVSEKITLTMPNCIGEPAVGY